MEGANNYTCICPSGFEGFDCEIETACTNTTSLSWAEDSKEFVEFESEDKLIKVLLTLRIQPSAFKCVKTIQELENITFHYDTKEKYNEQPANSTRSEETAYEEKREKNGNPQEILVSDNDQTQNEESQLDVTDGDLKHCQRHYGPRR